MIIMGIDQSLTCTGVAIIEGDTVLCTEGIRTKKDPDLDIVVDTVRRAKIIMSRIIELITIYDVDKVIVEGLSYASIGSSTRDLAILLGVITGRFNNTPTIVPPKVLKKYATGSGNADKDKMLEAIPNQALKDKLKNTPIAQGRFDIADAYWLANYKETK